MGSLVESLNLSNKYLEEINHSLFIYRLFSLKLSYSKQFPADGTEKVNDRNTFSSSDRI